MGQTDVENCSLVNTSVIGGIVIININNSWLLWRQHYHIQANLTSSITGISPIVYNYNISKYIIIIQTCINKGHNAVGTFDVISARVTKSTNTSICIACTVQPTTIDGCVMILLGNMDTITQELDRVSETLYYGCIQNIPPGVYRVIATDANSYISDGPVAINITTIVVMFTEETSTTTGRSITTTVPGIWYQ